MTTRPDGMQVIGGKASTIRSSRAVAHPSGSTQCASCGRLQMRVTEILGARSRRLRQEAGAKAVQFASRLLFIVVGADRTSLSWGSLLQAPTSSTRDHQPHGAPCGRHRTPSPRRPSCGRPAGHGCCLWPTAALIAMADGGLLLRGASVTVMVEGLCAGRPNPDGAADMDNSRTLRATHRGVDQRPGRG